jgi:hypothetical protein
MDSLHRRLEIQSRAPIGRHALSNSAHALRCGLAASKIHYKRLMTRVTSNPVNTPGNHTAGAENCESLRRSINLAYGECGFDQIDQIIIGQPYCFE